MIVCMYAITLSSALTFYHLYMYVDRAGNDDYLHRDKMAVLVRELTTAKK